MDLTASILPDSIHGNSAFQKLYCCLKNSIHSTYEDIKQSFINQQVSFESICMRILKEL